MYSLLRDTRGGGTHIDFYFGARTRSSYLDTMHIQEDVLLAEYTTFKLGGPADFFVSVATAKELQEALVWARQKNVPYVIIGGGSNVLFPDEGFRGLVIHIALKGIKYTQYGTTVLAQAAAGEHWDDFVLETVEKGLWGLENLSLIPGTVGATPVQNVGAYGVEVRDCVTEVHALDTQTDTVRVFSNHECAFSYRDSIFKKDTEKRYIVLSVCFSLSMKAAPKLAYNDLADYFKDRQTQPTLEEIRNAVIAIRKRKFPDLEKIGTAGSFFLNPIITQEKALQLTNTFPNLPIYPVDTQHVKISIAWILDHVLHLKGVRKGTVGLYENHVLALVNYGNATTREVLQFARTIQKNVFECTGVHIIPEVTFVTNKK